MDLTAEIFSPALSWRRGFDEFLTVLPKKIRTKSAAHLIRKQIQAIYRKEGKLLGKYAI